MYIHYYSRVKNGLNVEDIDKEIEYARGRIVTKVVASNAVDIPRSRKNELQYKATMLTRKRISDKTYTEFKIPKKSGGFRTLHAPSTELKEYQRDVKNFLEKTCKILPNNAVHSYIRNRNCKTAMEVHQKNHSRWFLKLDIQDFFDNITLDATVRALRDISPMCAISSDILRAVLEPCFLDGHLPQGSPASPVLSNLYLADFDHKLKLALGKDFVYTRYADDILISSRKMFGFSEVESEVNNLLTSLTEVKLKPSKTRFGSCNGANWNLGLMYNQDLGITVGHRHKHIMKCMIHNLYKQREDSLEWKQQEVKLQGLLGYYKFIEPEYFTTLIKKCKEKGYL